MFEINRNGHRFNLPRSIYNHLCFLFKTKFLTNHSTSFNPSIRYTFTSLLVGGSLYGISSLGCLQISAQRFLCVKNMRAAKSVAWLGCGFVVVNFLLSSLVAMNLYAKYYQCDPVKAKLISKADQVQNHKIFHTKKTGILFCV